MDLFAAIDSRSSAGRLSAPTPTPAHLSQMLHAAVRAPDHGHMAPWRFFIIEKESLGKFADAVAAARRIRTPDAGEEQVAAERAKIMRPPMIILVACVVVADHPKIPEIEQLLAVGAAVENLLLAAHDLGYGAVWKTGPAAYDANVKAFLGLRSIDHIVAMVHVGTAVMRGPVRSAKLDGIVTHL
jgi:nitroreductase